MDKFGPGSIAIGVAILVLILMFVSWRRRSRRDSVLAPPTTVPENRGALVREANGFFVAATVHDKPFERLAVRGLSFRGRVHLEVSSLGVLVEIPGESPIFLTAESIQRVSPATWAIDRVVETDGLILVAFTITSTASVPAASAGSPDASTADRVIVDTYFRFPEQHDRDAVLSALVNIAPAENSERTNAGSEAPDASR